MQPDNISKPKLWTGRILSGLIILFMLFDGIFKFVAPPEVVDITVNQLGYREHHLAVMGALALIATVLYAIPATAVLGAVLLTGYFGGAIATNLRVDSPLFGNILFPVYLGIIMWGGLWLRHPKLQALFPISKA
jgi:hypothetical protein